MTDQELSESAYQPRKRVSGVKNESDYKRNKIKRAKLTGEQHVNHKGSVIPPRRTGERCRCDMKCMEDIPVQVLDSIIHYVNKFDSKNAQDTYFQTLIEKQEIDRKRQRKDPPKRRNCNYIYSVIIDGSRKRVCKKAFGSIHGISEKQIRRLCNLLKDNVQPIDKRGHSVGSRHNAKSGEIISKIREHIESFPVKQVRYYKYDTTIYYLDERLDVKLMHKMFLEKYTDVPVKYKFFLKYFQENYNLSFGRKQIDVCAFCESLKLKLKLPHLNENAKRVYTAELEVHKRQANKFYKKIQEVQTKCLENPDIYGITFDFMQNLPLPHIPVQEIFYYRQLWLNEFCIHDLKTGKSVFYSYHEGVARKGPNEVCTFVLDYIKNNIPNQMEELHLFSDGCAGQNRNHAMVRTLLALASSDTYNIKTIHYYVPKRGHSFLPNDRMFGTAKRLIRKNDRIYTPLQYESMILESNEKFSVQRPLTSDILDFKQWWPTHYKKIVLSLDSYGRSVPKEQKKTFGISKTFHFVFKSCKPGVVETCESIDGLVKLEFRLSHRAGSKPTLPTEDLKAYETKNPINIKKMDDLKKLDKYIPHEFQDFYTEIFSWPTTSGNDEDFDD